MLFCASVHPSFPLVAKRRMIVKRICLGVEYILPSFPLVAKRRMIEPRACRVRRQRVRKQRLTRQWSKDRMPSANRESRTTLLCNPQHRLGTNTDVLRLRVLEAVMDVGARPNHHARQGRRRQCRRLPPRIAHAGTRGTHPLAFGSHASAYYRPRAKRIALNAYRQKQLIRRFSPFP